MHSKRQQHQPPGKRPPTNDAKTGAARDADAKPAAIDKDGVQGEGNYTAAREFDEAERKFVASGKVAAAARAAAPKTDAEQQEMLAAEEEGKRRAKGEVAPANRKEDK
jgi:hypothetical protein